MHENFGKKVSVQLNDTHPTISIVELLRILLDQENMNWVGSLIMMIIPVYIFS
jgi:glucan phosphorylase